MWSRCPSSKRTKHLSLRRYLDNVLHAAGLLKTSEDSGEMESWGQRGAGSWITVYANSVHAFAVIDGLRWDTVGDPNGVTGPRWHPSLAGDTTRGFVARHPTGY